MEQNKFHKVPENFITYRTKTSYDRKFTVINRLQEMFNFNDLTDGKLTRLIGGIVGGISGVILLDASTFFQLLLKSGYALFMMWAGAWASGLGKSAYNRSKPYITEYVRKLFKRKEKPHKVKRD